MNFYNRIKNKIAYIFFKTIKPEMIGGWKNSNGDFFFDTCISNMTHISQQSDFLYIGNNVFIGHFNYIDAFNAKLVISNSVQVTNYVSILTHSTHNSIRYNFPSFMNMDNTKLIDNVFIGENTYIGAHSTIMPGTRIGKGSIVSAFSYVKGEFPDFSIIRGQPAKVIGDTRDIDKKIILENPEFKNYYCFTDEIN
jgi:acetyltransferase-like isoleucine patch superfamily enzyme